jgi:hypothetical protein
MVARDHMNEGFGYLGGIPEPGANIDNIEKQ